MDQNVWAGRDKVFDRNQDEPALSVERRLLFTPQMKVTKNELGDTDYHPFRNAIFMRPTVYKPIRGRLCPSLLDVRPFLQVGGLSLPLY